MLLIMKGTIDSVKGSRITKYLGNKLKKEDGFWEYVVTVAIVLVIVAFMAVPQLRTFTNTALTAMTAWFNSIKNNIFQTS